MTNGATHVANPGAPQRIVGHFECTDENGNTELMQIALELRHWRALYEITSKAAEPQSVLQSIFEALDQVPADRFEAEVATYIETRFPALPASLGTVL